MKCRKQIYVIYVLIHAEMKQIILFFITFSGIYNGSAQKPIRITGCDSLRSANIPMAKIFPNPARHKVEIDVKGFGPGYLQIQIFDAGGKMVRNDQRLLFNGNEIITVMFALSPGIYFILLKQYKRMVKRKMVVI